MRSEKKSPLTTRDAGGCWDSCRLGTQCFACSQGGQRQPGLLQGKRGGRAMSRAIRKAPCGHGVPPCCPRGLVPPVELICAICCCCPANPPPRAHTSIECSSLCTRCPQRDSEPLRAKIILLLCTLPSAAGSPFSGSYRNSTLFSC